MPFSPDLHARFKAARRQWARDNAHTIRDYANALLAWADGADIEVEDVDGRWVDWIGIFIPPQMIPQWNDRDLVPYLPRRIRVATQSIEERLPSGFIDWAVLEYP